MEGLIVHGPSSYAYGVAGPQEIAQLTGKEILQAISTVACRSRRFRRL